MPQPRPQQPDAPQRHAPRGSGAARGVEWVAIALGVCVVLLGAMTLRPLIVPLAWAAILGYATWPVFAQLRSRLPGDALPALACTLVVAALIAVPAIGLSVLLKDELVTLVGGLQPDALARAGDRFVAQIGAVPWVGESVAHAAQRLLARPEQLLPALGQWLRAQTQTIAAFAGGVGADLIKVGVMFFALFFVYRDGEKGYAELATTLVRLFGRRANKYLQTAQATAKAIVYGILATAFAQGFAAGIGYWLAGLGAPALLGALTALAAVLPYGAAIVWVPVALWLALVSGEPWAALLLSGWAALVVGSVDNIVRPLVLSTAARVHVLPATIGVLGGLAAFGFIGIFIGPLVIVVLLAAWHAWVADAGIPAAQRPGRASDGAKAAHGEPRSGRHDRGGQRAP